MIKSNCGKVELKGPTAVIYAEMMAVVNATYNLIKEDISEEFADEIIKDIPRMALKSTEEIKKENAEMEKKITKDNEDAAKILEEIQKLLKEI